MPEPAMLDYFYGDEAEQYTFYRIPKVLFTDPAYRRISSDAKILYGLMLDRMGLSVRNGWLDDCQRVFIYFTLEDALEYLCCGHTKAVSLFGELDKGGLIERKKQGQGKPTKIYVKNFVRKAEVLTSKKRKSKVPQTGSQDFQKTASNNTEINNTDLNETDPSIYPVRGLPEDRPPAAADEMDTMEAYREVIKENIEYDIMRQQLGYNADLLDDILDIMVDTVCSSKRMFQQHEVIGKCPRCGSDVVEGKKNFYCTSRECQFSMWKDDRFFTSKHKELTKPMAAALLKNGRIKMKGLFSEKKGVLYLSAALARLTDRQRRVIELHFWQGYQYKEIAVILGCDPSAVTRLLQRAFKQIRIYFLSR